VGEKTGGGKLNRSCPKSALVNLEMTCFGCKGEKEDRVFSGKNHRFFQGGPKGMRVGR